MSNSIDTLQIKMEQRDFDLAVLKLWLHARETTGKTEDDIRAFTFRPEFLTLQEKIENSHAAAKGRPAVYCDKNWHNALRLKDESVIAMPGISRPIPPAWMAASARVTL